MPLYTTNTLPATGLTSGTVTISYDGQTTSALAYNASAEAIQSALEALSNVAEGEVIVTGGPIHSTPVTVSMLGVTSPVTATAVPTATAVITTTRQGSTTGNKVQALSVTATSGYIVLSCNGVTATGTLAYNANTSDVAAHISTIPALSGNVGVSGNLLNDGVGVSITYQGSLAGVDYASLVVETNQLSSDASLTLTKLTDGHGAINQIVTVSLSDFYDENTTSTMYFTYDGSSSATISYGDSPESVASALSQISALSGNVSVSGNNVGYGDFYIEFGGQLAGSNVSLSAYTSRGSCSISTTQIGQQSENTVYRLSNRAVGGTFALGYNSSTTTDIGYDATPNTVSAALANNIPEFSGNVSCSGESCNTTNGLLIEFGMSLAGVSVSLSVASDSLTPPTTSIYNAVTASPYDAGINERQSITIDGTATSGTFSLSFNNTASNSMDFDATASEVELALRPCFSNSPGNIEVTGGPLPATPIVVEFVGSNYKNRNLAAMTVGTNNLLGDTLNLEVVTVYPVQRMWYTIDKTASFSDSLSPLTLYAYQHSAFSYEIAIQKDKQPLDLTDMEIVFAVYDGEYQVAWQQEAVHDTDAEDGNKLIINCDDSRTEAAGTLLWMLKSTTDDVVLALGQLQIQPVAEEAV